MIRITIVDNEEVICEQIVLSLMVAFRLIKNKNLSSKNNQADFQA